MRSLLSMRGFTFVALSLVAGCATYRPYATHELRQRDNVRLVADSGFVMHAQVFNHTTQLQETCRLTLAEGTLHRVSADTIWLAPLTIARPVIGESNACRNLVRGYTIRGGQPNLGVTASRFDRRRAMNAVFWSALIGGIVAWWISTGFADVEGVP